MNIQQPERRPYQWADRTETPGDEEATAIISPTAAARARQTADRYPGGPAMGAFGFAGPSHCTPPGSVWPPPAGQPAVASYPGTPRKHGRTTTLVVTATSVVAVVVAVVGVVAGGWFGSTELNVTAAQGAITKLLAKPENGFGSAVTDVTCNHGQNPTVVKGASFTCTATIDGTSRQLTATFTDDTGNYDISAPR